MFDSLRQLKDIIAHYERLSLRFKAEMEELPPGCFLTRILKEVERYYHQYRLEGKTKQVYLNIDAADKLRPLMERKKKIRRFLRAWRLCRPALRQIVKLADRLLADEELEAALLELRAVSVKPSACGDNRRQPTGPAPAGTAGTASGASASGASSGTGAAQAAEAATGANHTAASGRAYAPPASAGGHQGLPPEIRLAGQAHRFYNLRQATPPYPERLTKTAASGLPVRSKSEMILADRLHSNGLAYFYEPGLDLGGPIIHPDFLIRRPGRDDYVLWEHRGVHDDGYLKSWIEKVQLYRKHGILEGVNLIVSYDSPEGDLNSYALQKQIEFYFASQDCHADVFAA